MSHKTPLSLLSKFKYKKDRGRAVAYQAAARLSSGVSLRRGISV